MWPDVETKDILDEFTDCVRDYIETPDFFPHKKAMGDWIAASHDLQESLKSYRVPRSDWKSFVKWGFDLHMKKDLDCWTPRSLCHLAPRWRRRKQDPDSRRERDKYLKWSE